MICKVKNNIEWLEFELFQQFPKLKHAVFLRKGGVSAGKYSSLNLGFKSSDSQENIFENLARALSCLDLKEWKRGRLDHGDHLIALEDSSQEEEVAFDGLMTCQKEIGLVITHADCQAGIFYDPVTNTLANIHSGWRGSVLNIFGKTVAKMQERYGVRPENLFVGISPSLGPDEAEFVNYKTDLPMSFWPFQSKENHFDFWQISKMQLQNAGLRLENIQIAGIPTMKNPQDFFSYRRDKSSARNATIAALSSSR